MKALLGLLGTLLAAAIILAGPAVYWLDRHTLAVPVNLGPLHFTWRPFGEAIGVRLTECDTNTEAWKRNAVVLDQALRRQNAALAAISAEGHQLAVRSEKAVQRARSEAVEAEKVRAAISAPLTESDVCLRAQEVDRRLMESLK